MKIAIEAKLKKQLILVKKPNTEGEQNSTGTGSLEPSTTSKRKVLPPLNNLRHSNNSPSLSMNQNQFTGTNRSAALGDLTPVMPSKGIQTVKHQKTKKDPLFVTCEFLDTSNFNASLNLSKVEKATEGDNTG